MDKDHANAAARDAFSQAEDGYAVELDPALAEAMGAFTEDALTLQDILEGPDVEP